MFVMKVRSIVMVGLFASLASAAPRSPEEISNVALNFAAQKMPQIASQLKLSSTNQAKLYASENGSQPNYQIIHLKPTGWVIVSTDDVARPILAYNLESNRTEKVPVNFREWMQGIDEQIQWAKENQLPSSFSKDWKTLAQPHEQFLSQLSKEPKLEAGPTKAVKGPLLETEWSQDKYYNAKCPADPNGPDGHVYTGCVATAMVQIMKYYNWPRVGKGKHSYESDYGTLSANFGKTKYHWKSMPVPKPNQYNNPLATAMYHAGVAVDMQYSAEGSGAYMSDANEALNTYFRYRTSGLAEKNDMAEEDWARLLKKEIDANRPLLYAGSGSQGGHAFVCDGYDYSNPQNKKFHFNWGWGGYYNGYYSIGALNPANYSFNGGNEVIYGIKPIRIMKSPSHVTVRKVTKTSAVIEWEDTTNNEKGFRIYNGSHVIKTVKANTFKTKIGHLIPGTRYTLRVAAFRPNAESRHVPVRFRTRGKQPSILPIYMNQTLDGKLTPKEKSTHRDTYAKYYTFKLTKAQKVVISVSSKDFYAGIFVMEGKDKHGPTVYSTYTYAHQIDEHVDLEAGRYTIEVNSYYSDVTGKFSISLHRDK